MNKYEYEVVEKNSKSELPKSKRSRKLFLRQLFISSGVWTSMFLYGLQVGAPTVFIPQIRRETNSTDVITVDMASWLTSIYSFSGFPFVIILSIITRLFGRRIPFTIACVDTLAALILLYCSTNVTHIMISQAMQGLYSASQIVVAVFIITEYTSPKYRGIFLTIKTATFYWGIWVANAIGTFFHWKMIVLFGVACAAYILLTVLAWPESPYWLASKERFEECATSHRWLKGRDEESEKELENLINSQKENIASCRGDSLSKKQRVVDAFQTVKKIEFYKPTLITILTGTLGVFSGKLVCSLYAIDLIKKITSSESTAYMGMLVLDGVTVFSMYGGCILAKYFPRRTLLLVSSSIGVIFMFIISLYLYLVTSKIIGENKYASIFLLSAFSIAVSCGPLIMSASIYGELIPLRSRNLAICIIGLVSKVEVGVSLKVAPYIFETLGLHGTFLTFGLLSSINIILLYKYLPETKDKTLQEIAESITGLKPKKNNGTAKLMLTE